MTATQDLLAFTYEEADTLLFLAQSYIEDHASESDSEFHLGNQSEQRVQRRALKRLEAFTNMKKRCGVMGPALKCGDFPRCSRRPHSGGLHHRFDAKTGRHKFWRGDHTSSYIDTLKQPGRVS